MGNYKKMVNAVDGYEFVAFIDDDVFATNGKSIVKASAHGLDWSAGARSVLIASPRVRSLAEMLTVSLTLHRGLIEYEATLDVDAAKELADLKAESCIQSARSVFRIDELVQRNRLLETQRNKLLHEADELQLKYEAARLELQKSVEQVAALELRIDIVKDNAANEADAASLQLACALTSEEIAKNEATWLRRELAHHQSVEEADKGAIAAREADVSVLRIRAHESYMVAACSLFAAATFAALWWF